MRIELLLASTMWFPMDGRDHPPRLTHVRTVSGGTARNITKCFGGHSERETPGHIPNPEAKTLSADGTARETSWESRTPPDFFNTGGGHPHPRATSPFFYFHTAYFHTADFHTAEEH